LTKQLADLEEYRPNRRTEIAIRRTRQRSWWARNGALVGVGVSQLESTAVSTGPVAGGTVGTSSTSSDMDERLIHPTLDAIRGPHVPEPERLDRFHEREFITRLEVVLDRGLRAMVGARFALWWTMTVVGCAAIEARSKTATYGERPSPWSVSIHVVASNKRIRRASYCGSVDHPWMRTSQRTDLRATVRSVLVA
jgi:hypothetical protein